MYIAEDFWRFGLSPESWPIGDIGEIEWIATLRIYKREGGIHQLDGDPEDEAEEKWRCISLEYWHLTIHGAYMGRKWISPVDLRDSLIWRSKHQISCFRSRGEIQASSQIKGEAGLVRESVGNGAGNPAIDAKESTIQNELATDFDEQVRERAGNGGQRLGEGIHPAYGMLRRSLIRIIYRRTARRQRVWGGSGRPLQYVRQK